MLKIFCSNLTSFAASMDFSEKKMHNRKKYFEQINVRRSVLSGTGNKNPENAEPQAEAGSKESWFRALFH